MTVAPSVLRVWAPRARSVEIEVGGLGRRSMAPEPDGWWVWRVEGVSGSLDYAFVLDGSEPALPDPRSRWQPHGVHGPSRWVDPSTFTWSDQPWHGVRSGAGILGAVIYELHVGTFTLDGTLDAAIDRLDDLVDLGVDVVEVMPVAAFPGRWGWGYDGVALRAVHDGYGGPEALVRFVDACHARGLGVCLDVVLNHLGPSGNYLGRFGPYFTQKHTTPWGPAVNLDDEGAEEVRAFLVGTVLGWLRDYHVDAIRLDAVHELMDDSSRHFLAELSAEVASLASALGRPLDLIAETDLNDVTMVTAVAEGGLGMTAQWDDDIHHALHVALTGETQGYYADFAGGTEEHSGPLAVLASVLTGGFLHDGRYSTFRDTAWGAPVDRERLDARRLLASLQTHDQVGNRALGDRIGATLSAGQLAIGAALVLLGPFTPMLFMGEEWAASTPWQFFTDFEDDAMGEAVRAGRRVEFGRHGWDAEMIPDPQSAATRLASVLRPEERFSERHSRVREWYAVCIRLRRNLLRDQPTRLADVDVRWDEDQRWCVMRHAPAGGTAYEVICNLGEASAVVPTECREVLASWTAQDREPGAVSPRSVMVCR